MNSKKYKIPINWPFCVACLCIPIPILICVTVYMFNSKNYEPAFPVVFFTIIIVISMCKQFKSFVLDEEGITCYKFGRFHKRFLWEDVVQVGIVTRGGGGVGSHNTYIVVTPKGVPMFDSKKIKGGDYLVEYEDQTITMNETKKACEAFLSTYGRIDYGKENVFWRKM